MTLNDPSQTSWSVQGSNLSWGPAANNNVTINGRLVGLNEGVLSFVPFDRCPGGHSVDGDLIRYVDGIVVGYCGCGERWQLQGLPGSDVALRTRELAAEMLEDRSNGSHDPEKLSRLNEMVTELRNVQAEVEAALALAEIAGG